MSCRQAGTTTITNFNDAEYDEDADEDYVDDSNSDDSEERSLGSEDSATNSDSDDNETDSEGLESDEADGLGEEGGIDFRPVVVEDSRGSLNADGGDLFHGDGVDDL